MTRPANRLRNEHVARFRRSFALIGRALAQNGQPAVAASSSQQQVSAEPAPGPTEAVTNDENSATAFFQTLPWDNDVGAAPRDEDQAPAMDTGGGPATTTRLSILPGRDALSEPQKAAAAASQAPTGNIVLAGAFDAMSNARQKEPPATDDDSSSGFFQGLPWDGVESGVESTDEEE